MVKREGRELGEKRVERDIVDRTFEFALRVLKLCRYLGEKSSTYRTISTQLLRSGTSIGANVEEAQAGQSKSDFVSKFNIALKEARETSYWLRLLIADEVFPNDRLQPILDESEEIKRVLAQIIINTKKIPR